MSRFQVCDTRLPAATAPHCRQRRDPRSYRADLDMEYQVASALYDKKVVVHRISMATFESTCGTPAVHRVFIKCLLAEAQQYQKEAYGFTLHTKWIDATLKRVSASTQKDKDPYVGTLMQLSKWKLFAPHEKFNK